jgi:hypothetical protein
MTTSGHPVDPRPLGSLPRSQKDKGHETNSTFTHNRQNFRYFIKCGAVRLMNSRVVMILVFFQNLGKCFRLPVIK